MIRRGRIAILKGLNHIRGYHRLKYTNEGSRPVQLSSRYIHYRKLRQRSTDRRIRPRRCCLREQAEETMASRNRDHDRTMARIPPKSGVRNDRSLKHLEQTLKRVVFARKRLGAFGVDQLARPACVNPEAIARICLRPTGVGKTEVAKQLAASSRRTHRLYVGIYGGHTVIGLIAASGPMSLRSGGLLTDCDQHPTVCVA